MPRLSPALAHVLALALTAHPAIAADPPPLAPIVVVRTGPPDPPVLMSARALDGGRVEFTLPRPWAPGPGKAAPTDDDPYGSHPRFYSVAVAVDGKAVRAVGPDGKPLDAAEVARRLAKAAPVAVFHGDAADPFYLRALRDDGVAFVARPEAFVPGRLDIKLGGKPKP